MPRRLAPLLLGSVLALAGCSGSDDDPAATPSTDSSAAPTTSVRTSACPHVNPEDVATVLGEQASLLRAAEDSCSFLAGLYTVTITWGDIGADPHHFVEAGRSACRGAVTEVDAGDEAFACLASGAQGFMHRGSDAWVVGIAGASDDDAGVALAAELLPLIGR